VITDETVQSRYSHVELAEMAAAGGADVVQLREKRDVSTQALLQAARRIREGLAGTDCVLAVNDRVDVALAAGAGLVHLGRRDLPTCDAREIVGEGVAIGATANDLEEAIEAAKGPADYLGVGPVFGTSSKADPAPTLGLQGLREIVDAVDLPVVAIGGITADRVADVLDAGAHGVAVLSDVVCAKRPTERVRIFREALDRAHAGARS
jgi:thiamine-phosphate pyrophosphorylase